MKKLSEQAMDAYMTIPEFNGSARCPLCGEPAVAMSTGPPETTVTWCILGHVTVLEEGEVKLIHQF